MTARKSLVLLPVSLNGLSYPVCDAWCLCMCVCERESYIFMLWLLQHAIDLRAALVFKYLSASCALVLLHAH